MPFNAPMVKHNTSGNRGKTEQWFPDFSLSRFYCSSSSDVYLALSILTYNSRSSFTLREDGERNLEGHG